MSNTEVSSPLYTQLTDDLIAYISEKAAINEKMLSERELCKQYHVSRTTVRTALMELEDMGYVYKRAGIGTFVSGLWREKQNLLDTYSFTEQMAQLGKKAETQIDLFELKKCSQSVADLLGIDEYDLVYKMRRLRLADGIPMLYETTYVPAYLFKDLDIEKIKTDGLYNVFDNQYGQKISYADEEFSAGLIEDREVEKLNLTEGLPCLRIKRLARNQSNQIVELTLSVARSDQFVYKVRHFRHYK